MRTHLILAESWPSMQKAVADAQSFLKVFGVTITTERRNVDVSSPELYEVTWSWSKLKYEQTRSLKSSYIYGLASLERALKSDCIGLLLDKHKAPFEDATLRGQQNTFGVKQVTEVYCTQEKQKLYGFERNSYVLIHELMHSLADHHGVEDTLHKYLDDKKNKTLDAYKWDLLTRASKSDWALLPVVYEKVKLLMLYADSIGLPIRVTEGYRSPERQDQLYAQRPKVTNAKAWESMHQYRVAFDIVFRVLGYNATDAQWKKVADYGKSIGLSWGGDWQSFLDRPHFELTFGKSLKDFQKNNIDWTKYWTQPAAPTYQFTRDLYIGITGEDVRELQKYLNRNGFIVAASGNGSIGHESDYFGPATQKALIAFQVAKGIKPPSGYFGPITRSFIASEGNSDTVDIDSTEPVELLPLGGMNETSKFAFLASPRFWQLAIVGLMAGLSFALPDNVWVDAAAITIGIWFGGSVTVRTVDRFGDKKVEAAAIAE